MKNKISPIVVFISLILDGCCSGGSCQSAPPDLNEAFNKLAYYKSLSESQVRRAKSYMRDYPDASKDLREAQDDYNDTSARGNALITTIKLDLTAPALAKSDLQSEISELIQGYRKLFEKVDSTKLSKDIWNYEQQKKDYDEKVAKAGPNDVSIAPPVPPPPLAGTVTFSGGADIIEGIAKAGIDVWQAAQNARAATVENLKKELDTCCVWKPWDAIN